MPELNRRGDSRTSPLCGLHIAVVDDNRDAREILATLLTAYGALVTTARTAKEAISQFDALRPDVVIADMLLGTEDALILAEHAQRTSSPVPFIAISGADFNVEQLKFVGFAAYLRKPLNHRVLLETIRQVIPRSSV